MNGVTSRHDTDRALRELLEETRIAQMGGQIGLGFLLAVAYTPVIRGVGEGDRVLYAWAVAVTTSAVVLLLAPVPLHRLNFGRRVRPEILVVAHVVTIVGLACLGAGIVLSVGLASRIAVSAATGWLVGVALALVVLSWVVLPLILRWRTGPTSSRWDAESARSQPGEAPAEDEGVRGD